MRKFFALFLAIAGLAVFGLSGCTDAGDPVFPSGSTVPVIIIVNDLVGGVDNLQVNGALTGNTPVAMNQDGLLWRTTIQVTEGAGDYGYGLYTEDGSKALVPVVEGLTIMISDSGLVTGDTDVDRNPGPGTGFRLVVNNGNPAYENIRIKGAINDWTPEITGYTDDFTTWYLDVAGDLAEGTYEWGVIEDDGSEWGIWLLPPGPNLAVVIDSQGAPSGDLTFDIASPQPETTLTFNCDMNAFEGTYNTVHVRGSFNGWDTSPTNMADDDEDGIFTVTVTVEQGMDYLFKFITDGSNYEDVPAACGADDGYGGYNRSVSIGTEAVVYTTPWADCPATK